MDMGLRQRFPLSYALRPPNITVAAIRSVSPSNRVAFLMAKSMDMLFQHIAIVDPRLINTCARRARGM